VQLSKASLLVKFANPATKSGLIQKLGNKKVLKLLEVYENLSNDDKARILLRDDVTTLQRNLYKEAKDVHQMFELKFCMDESGRNLFILFIVYGSMNLIYVR
jgi:hypothetical protein